MIIHTVSLIYSSSPTAMQTLQASVSYGRVNSFLVVVCKNICRNLFDILVTGKFTLPQVFLFESLSTERSNGSMCGHMSLQGSKTSKWCWPERLQTTTTTGYTRLWGMSPPMSLLAKWRMGINED